MLDYLQQKQLEQWVQEAVKEAQNGQIPDYIPQLANALPTWISIQVQTIQGQRFSVGDMSRTFALMSVVKPYLLLYLLCNKGAESVFSKVGVQPSDLPFNSIKQLKLDGGKPRNPMINSGAITLAALLPGENAVSKCTHFTHWLNNYGLSNLYVDESLLASVNSKPNQINWNLANQLEMSGYLCNPQLAMDTYNRVCCLSGNIGDLCGLGMLLLKKDPDILKYSTQVLAVMMTCGLYQASATFAVEVGIPCKSGVSGTMLAIVPGQGAIACYSPPLDSEGNSVAGIFIVKKLAQSFHLSVFS